MSKSIFKRKKKAQCKRGHRFTKRNTYIDKNGAQNCLKCRRMHSIARSQHPGIGSGGVQRIKTHCVNGHLFSKDNTWIRRSGGRKERRCKTCSRRRTRERNRRLKLEVINAYGGKCAWKGCDVTDPDMLTLDHVKDDGATERKRGLTSSDSIYKSVINQDFPAKYQILCANHNLKKELMRIRAGKL